MKIKITVWESERCNINLEDELHGYASVRGIFEDLEKVVELHRFRAEKYKQDYIARWGKDTYETAFPAPAKDQEMKP